MTSLRNFKSLAAEIHDCGRAGFAGPFAIDHSGDIAMRPTELPNPRRHWLLAATAALAMPWAASAQAQATWPSRPVVMVVPQTAGGTNDIVGRLVSQKLGEVLNASVVVENRPGAGGNIGTQAVGKAPKDGYTLLMTISSSQAINPALYKNAGFDPVKDFRPVSLIGAVPNVLLVNPSFPAKTVAELVALAKGKPGQYQYASAGNGTLNHLLGEMLNSMAGIGLQHVPYKGVAPAMNDGRAAPRPCRTRSPPRRCARWPPRWTATTRRPGAARRCRRCGTGCIFCRTTATARSALTAMASAAAFYRRCRCRGACGPAGG
jgi:hypothetical protein